MTEQEIIEKMARAMKNADGDFPMSIEEYVPYAQAAYESIKEFIVLPKPLESEPSNA